LLETAAIGTAAAVGRAVTGPLALAAAGTTPPAAAAVASKGSAWGNALQSLTGKVYLKGDPQYEALRQAASWNARKPKRFPEAIVLAESEADVVSAVKLAKERSWQVSARSGGHSWSASHTRDHSVQINLAKMTEMELDPKERIVKISPAVSGNQLNKWLREKYGLFTPSAHGVNVGMGGFVMAGGHGWNSRVLGLGCENLMALDLVTADGELIHASETQNSDFLWAARGAGPGFFGVATRYYMKVYPRPKVMRQSGYIYGIKELEPVMSWLRTSMVNFPRNLEVVAITMAAKGEPTIMVAATCLADSEQEVRANLAVLGTCPAANRARSKWSDVEVSVPLDAEAADEIQPTGARFAVDNLWTNASSAELMPLLHRLLTDYPTPQSNIFWLCWGPPKKIPDMAYSVQADVFIAANAVYYDPSDDERCEKWVVDAVKRLDSVSAGAQMNDENTEHHWTRYLSDSAARRLEAMRTKYDPQGRFPGFLRS
jgi:FAD/FMN-containing dehydrogenase